MFQRKLNIKLEELETSRLKLVALSDEYLDDIFQIYYEYDVIRFTDSNLHFNKEDTAAFIKNTQHQFNDKQSIFWGLILKSSNKLIGTIGLYHIDHKHFSASISCLLGKHYWRLGYMTEALKVIIPYSFNNLLLNRVEAQMYIHHDASINLFEKLQFTREAMLRENFQIEWKQENSYVYSMLKSEFENLKSYYGQSS